jgi:hypothetical protein
MRNEAHRMEKLMEAGRWFGQGQVGNPPHAAWQMLIDHMTAGFSLDEFLETVSSLERVQAQRFLELAGEQMQECASSLNECVILLATKVRPSRKWAVAVPDLPGAEGAEA